jgi:hypothetical protein
MGKLHARLPACGLEPLEPQPDFDVPDFQGKGTLLRIITN